jgi:hypothetical protein
MSKVKPILEGYRAITAHFAGDEVTWFDLVPR